MTMCAPDNYGSTGKSPEQRQYFPSAVARHATQGVSFFAERAPHAADYSPLISVAYALPNDDRDTDHLATGFERRNDGPQQPPKAEECAPAHRAGIDARAAWRRFGLTPDRAGAVARPSRRARGVREADKGTPHDALLTLQESAL